MCGTEADHPSATNRSRQPTMPPFILSTYSYILHTLSRADSRYMQDTFLWIRTWYVICNICKVMRSSPVSPNVVHWFVRRNIENKGLMIWRHNDNMTWWHDDILSWCHYDIMTLWHDDMMVWWHEASQTITVWYILCRIQCLNIDVCLTVGWLYLCSVMLCRDEWHLHYL